MTRRVIPVGFVASARAHLAATGRPLLEYSRGQELETIYAVSWDQRSFVLQTVPGAAAMVVRTLREYLEHEGWDEGDFFEEYPALSRNDLDREAPAEFQNPEEFDDVTGEILSRLSGKPLDGRYYSSDSLEPLGEVRFWDGPAPGCDYQAVEVSSAMALSCLQYLLDKQGLGYRIELGESYELSELNAALDDARRREQPTDRSSSARATRGSRTRRMPPPSGRRRSSD